MGLLDDQRRQDDEGAQRLAEQAAVRQEDERAERERDLAAGRALVKEFLAEVSNRNIKPDFTVMRVAPGVNPDVGCLWILMSVGRT